MTCSAVKVHFLIAICATILLLHRHHTPQVSASALEEEELEKGGGDFLTHEEKELVEKLRLMVKGLIYKEYMNDDDYLVRFLRVRNYNLDAAAEMIAKAMRWRIENKIDSVLTEDYEEVESKYSIIFEGTDNHGRPILLINIGILDIRKIVLSGSGQVSKYFRFFEGALELAESVLRAMKAGAGGQGQGGTTTTTTSPSPYRNVSRAYIIVDLNGFNLRQHACIQCLPIIPRIASTYENYYPDRLYRVVALNTPSAFLPIFELVRPFLSKPSQAAFKLFGHDSTEWKEFLRSEIPEDQLPTLYGGSSSTVVPKSFKQLRESNPYVGAAYKTAFEDQKTTRRQSQQSAAATPAAAPAESFLNLKNLNS